MLIIDFKHKTSASNVFRLGLYQKLAAVIGRDGLNVLPLTMKKGYPFTKETSKDPFAKKIEEFAPKHSKMVIEAIKIISILFAIPSTTVYIVIHGFRFILAPKRYKREYLHTSIFGIDIVDCVYSSYLRSNNSSGYLQVDPLFIRLWIVFMFNFFSFYFFEKLISRYFKRKGHKIFFIQDETTYVFEAYRRVLHGDNINELKLFNNFSLIKIDKLKGYEINKLCPSLPTDITDNVRISDLELSQGREKIHSLVYRQESYSYLSEVDIDTSIKIDLYDFAKLQPHRKVSIIFMHLVSDAQFYMGYNCFSDLHDWLMTSVDLLKRNNYDIIIKLHPNFYQTAYDYPADRRYLDFLGEEFKVDFWKLPKNKVVYSDTYGVYFISHEYSLPELSSSFPDFLCITHHGSVACEAAYLGHRVICNRASPYDDEDSFVELYESIESYEDLLKKASISEDGRDKETTLYRYIYKWIVLPKLYVGTYVGYKIQDFYGYGISDADFFRLSHELEKKITIDKKDIQILEIVKNDINISLNNILV